MITQPICSTLFARLLSCLTCEGDDVLGGHFCPKILCTLTSDEETEDESPPEDASPQVTTLPLPINAANALAVE